MLSISMLNHTHLCGLPPYIGYVVYNQLLEIENLVIVRSTGLKWSNFAGIKRDYSIVLVVSLI
jgi:hypothetical protein